MPKFRKKPVEVEAFRLGYDNLPDWFMDKVSANDVILIEARLAKTPFKVCAKVATLEGVMTAEPGDWIIRGVAGEVYPCKPDLFAANYEPTEAA